uniref:Uncharacterized protein n=1 Tax=Cannabis sativa TaxID=3483 RepID=A0A803QBS2_CANSA
MMKMEKEIERELGHQLINIERSKVWKRLHTNKKGEVEGPTTNIVKQIDDLRKQVEERTIRVEGKKEILTMALGTNEYGGQYSGVVGTSHASYSDVGGESNEPACAKFASAPQAPPPRAAYVSAPSTPPATNKNYAFDACSAKAKKKAIESCDWVCCEGEITDEWQVLGP